MESSQAQNESLSGPEKALNTFLGYPNTHYKNLAALPSWLSHPPSHRLGAPSRSLVVTGKASSLLACLCHVDC